MKHKAQEALNKIVEHSCPKRTNCKSCEISNRCNALMKDEVDKIQRANDCQLTVEEINQIMNCLSVACFDSEQYNSIFNKLKKQKEM